MEEEAEQGHYKKRPTGERVEEDHEEEEDKYSPPHAPSHPPSRGLPNSYRFRLLLDEVLTRYRLLSERHRLATQMVNTHRD